MTSVLYRYAALDRPAGYKTVPDKGLWSIQDVKGLHTDRGERVYSIVEYKRQLTPREVKVYGLEYIEQVLPDSMKESVTRYNRNS